MILVQPVGRPRRSVWLRTILSKHHDDANSNYAGSTAISPMKNHDDSSLHDNCSPDGEADRSDPDNDGVNSNSKWLFCIL